MAKNHQKLSGTGEMLNGASASPLPVNTSLIIAVHRLTNSLVRMLLSEWVTAGVDYLIFRPK